MRRLLATALAAVFALACAAPAAADDGYVDVGVSATLDQAAYLPSDVMTMEVRVVNSGTATATGVVVAPQGDLEFAPWGELGGSGIELAPGASVNVYVTAKPNDSGDGMTERLEAVSAEPDRNPDDNVTTVTSFVTVEQADLTVTVYGDADRDGVVDAGETRAGVLVMLSGGINATDVSARTDAAGVVRFPGLAGGRYVPFVNLPKGWYVDVNQHIDIRAGNNTALIRATVNDMTALSASVSLDRDSYAPGDIIRERVTLTNSGATDITGVVAHCGGWGALDNVLFSAGWGELRPDSAGAVVRAGETRTWEFTDVVPSQAWDYGFVSLRCDFSPDAGADGPVAEARAAVPGGHSSMSGRLVDTDSNILVGVRILLIDPVGGAVVARAVSDGNGRFQLPEVPAGLYEVRPIGPWRLYEMAVFTLYIMAGRPTDFDPLILMPGPAQGDPDAPTGPTGPSTVDVVPAPAPQAAPLVRPANLADTGANVVELAALGFLLLVAGALLLRARRV
jgi:LPXTG-motif cell wall-anchored protein